MASTANPRHPQTPPAPLPSAPAAPPVDGAVDQAVDESLSASGIPLRMYPGYDAERGGFVHLDPREEARKRIEEASKRLASS